MDLRIGKMHRELATLYEERARAMQAARLRDANSASDLDFDPEVIDELAQETHKKRARKSTKANAK